MRGNAAIMKCTIPSFVADFVNVEAWLDEDGIEFAPSMPGNFSGGKILADRVKSCSHSSSEKSLFKYF